MNSPQTLNYQIPTLALKLAAWVCSIVGALFIWLGFQFGNWLPNEPAFFAYVFLFFGAVTLFTSYRTYKIKQWPILNADSQGIYFPCPVRRTCQSEFLHVRWSHVGAIDIGNVRLSNGVGKGVKIEVKVTDSEKREFFPDSIMSLASNKENEGWYSVGLTSAFLPKKKCESELNKLKSVYQR